MADRLFIFKTGILTRMGEGVRHWWGAHGVAARNGKQASEQRRYDTHDFAELERVAALAYNGYFHIGYVTDPFVFMAEIPLRNNRCTALSEAEEKAAGH